MKVFLCLLLGLAFARSSMQSHLDLETEINRCGFAPGYRPGNETFQLHCCNVSETNMLKNWKKGSLYLTTYLLNLKSWQCPQFANECNKPTFDFNPFSKTVYLYFCNQIEFESSCQSEVSRLLPQDTPVSSLTWQAMVGQLDSSRLNIEQLLRPCTQLALFEKERSDEKFGKYHEAVAPNLPFCELNWCGTDDASYRNDVIDIWNCMSARCRANIVIIFIGLIILSIAIITANVTVIAVFRRNKKLRNSQSVYKLSLACADLIVGVIVVPTFVSTLGVLMWPSVKAAVDTKVIGFQLVNGSLHNTSTIASYQKPTGYLATHLTRGYVGFVGFFTLTSFVVSAYTLMVASIDRFRAVFRPLRYNRHEAEKLARSLSIVIWIISFIFASLPLYVPGLNYSLIASVLIASSGSDEVVVLYAVAIGIPLIVVWVTTTSTYVMARKHARKRKNISTSSHDRNKNMEQRLVKTLAIMVGVFTLNLLPAIIVLVASIGSSNISFSKPKQLDLIPGSIYASSEFVAIVVLASNSLWNMFIYNARNKDFQNVADSMFEGIKSTLGITRCLHQIRSSCGSTKRRLSSTGGTVSSPSTNSTGLSSKKTTSSQKFSSTSPTQSKTMKSSTYSSSAIDEESVNQSEGNRKIKQAHSATSADCDVNSNTKLPTNNESAQLSDKSESAMADSVFDSYVIDVNADRLFVSTMEGIAEENEV